MSECDTRGHRFSSANLSVCLRCGWDQRQKTAANIGRQLPGVGVWQCEACSNQPSSAFSVRKVFMRPCRRVGSPAAIGIFTYQRCRSNSPGERRAHQALACPLAAPSGPLFTVSAQRAQQFRKFAAASSAVSPVAATLNREWRGATASHPPHDLWTISGEKSMSAMPIPSLLTAVCQTIHKNQDAELLIVGNLPAACFVMRHDVY